MIQSFSSLLKNRHTYRNRIGAPDDDHATTKNEGSDDEDAHNGSNTDSWDKMYQMDKEGNNGEDKVITLRMEMRKGMRIMRRMMRTWKLVAAGMGVGMRVGVRTGIGTMERKDGSCSVSGRKDDEGRNGTKRKNRDDEPVTRAKRTKWDVSGGHQATQPMKKLLSRKKSGKK